jgi:hypothetical protein
LPDDTKISLSTEAEGAWTAGELKHFDPLVGNSLCEIPTLVIARLYDEYRKHPIDKDVLEKFPKTLFLFNKEMLEKSPEMLFLFVAFLLTKYKKSKQDASKICGYSEWIDLKKDDVRVIPNSCLNHAQRLIAAMSIAYLEKHCETGPLPIFFDMWGRYCAHFYTAIFTALNVIKLIGIPLIIDYKFFCSSCGAYHMKKFFVKADGNYYLKFTEPSQKDVDKPVIVYDVWACSEDFIEQGGGPKKQLNQFCFCDRECSEFKSQLDELQANGIEQLILLEAAQHPQWPNSRATVVCNVRIDASSESTDKSPERRKKSEMANNIGASKKNPSLFLVNHVSAGTVREHYPQLMGMVKKNS